MISALDTRLNLRIITQEPDPAVREALEIRVTLTCLDWDYSGE
jgi:hypothetical protein